MPNEFQRRLCKGSESAEDAALAYLQSKPAWWEKLLNATYEGRNGKECRLFIALRDGYMNAYANGQSVLKIGFKTDGDNIRPHCKIHPEFLGLKKKEGDKRNYVLVDVSEAGHAGYHQKDGLNEWIIRAALHGAKVQKEKSGIALILANHSCIIDVEMGLPANSPTEEETTKRAFRMDIVALEPHGEGAQIVFYEVKCFSNGDLRSKTGKPKVHIQLGRYKAYVSHDKRRREVIAAYRRTCGVLDSIAIMRGQEADALIRNVAKDENFRLEMVPEPRLIIIDFTEQQEATESWARHEKALQPIQVIMAARPDHLRLC